MRNKLIIISFLLLSASAAVAQLPKKSSLQEVDISIYPNPAVEYIIVEVDNALDNAQFELNSMIGNKIIVTPEDLGYGKFRISLKNFATGYYFLIVKNNGVSTAALKFLKN